MYSRDRFFFQVTLLHVGKGSLLFIKQNKPQSQSIFSYIVTCCIPNTTKFPIEEANSFLTEPPNLAQGITHRNGSTLSRITLSLHHRHSNTFILKNILSPLNFVSLGNVVLFCQNTWKCGRRRPLLSCQPFCVSGCASESVHFLSVFGQGDDYFFMCVHVCVSVGTCIYVSTQTSEDNLCSVGGSTRFLLRQGPSGL